MTEKQKELKGTQLETIVGGDQLSPKITVPDVIGKSFDEAKSELENVSFRIDCRYVSSSKPKDVVIVSDPLPGSKADKDSVVMLTLSVGR